nr:protein HOMOLOG OF MAMMALIAN LYST-INTERACTING PROTEIN 5 [Ipomoea batatas]
MAAETEPAKLLLPYLQRADELQKHEPLVAYYCRLYAMERGLRIPQNQRTKTTNSLLVSLMNQLEKDKKSLQLGPDDHLHLEGFALSVFAKADKQDRAGRADLNTAKTFYAASIFFEIINQFGVLQPDVEQKQKYAAWKAADIRKALKEGRKPVPGPPGGENDAPGGGYDLEPSRSDPSVTPATEFDDNSQHFSNKQPSPDTMPPPPSSHVPSLPPSYRTDDYPSHNNYQSHNFQQPPPNNRPEDDYQSHGFPQPPPGNRSEDDYQSHSFPQPPPSNRSENDIPSYDYQSHNFQPPTSHNSENPSYPQPYNHQPYNMQEPQTHLPQNYPPHDIPSYSYPNFQSYPSFAESSLPSVPSHYPSYYQGSDASLSTMPSSNATTHPSAASQYNPSDRNGATSEAAAPPSLAKKYQYDSSYEPPPEKISEAHKAARFAVGALAFDDVSVAVDYLKKSLELLTNPSAGN